MISATHSLLNNDSMELQLSVNQAHQDIKRLNFSESTDMVDDLKMSLQSSLFLYNNSLSSIDDTSLPLSLRFDAITHSHLSLGDCLLHSRQRKANEKNYRRNSMNKVMKENEIIEKKLPQQLTEIFELLLCGYIHTFSLEAEKQKWLVGDTVLITALNTLCTICPIKIRDRSKHRKRKKKTHIDYSTRRSKNSQQIQSNESGEVVMASDSSDDYDTSDFELSLPLFESNKNDEDTDPDENNFQYNGFSISMSNMENLTPSEGALPKKFQIADYSFKWIQRVLTADPICSSAQRNSVPIVVIHLLRNLSVIKKLVKNRWDIPEQFSQEILDLLGIKYEFDIDKLQFTVSNNSTTPTKPISMRTFKDTTHGVLCNWLFLVRTSALESLQVVVQSLNSSDISSN